MTEYEKRSLHYLSQIDELLRVLIDEVRRLPKERAQEPPIKSGEHKPFPSPQMWPR